MSEVRLVGVRRHTFALDLQVERGELVALVGPSGAGKTTALRIIAGLERPDAGLVDAPPPRDVALVSHGDPLYGHLSVYENLAFALRRQRLADHEIAPRVAAVARELGLERLLGRRPGVLSTGERQRVALGCASARAPRLFLFDDPRPDLVREVVRIHRAAGATSIVATTEAIAIADRVVTLGPSQVSDQHEAPHRDDPRDGVRAGV